MATPLEDTLEQLLFRLHRAEMMAVLALLSKTGASEHNRTLIKRVLDSNFTNNSEALYTDLLRQVYRSEASQSDAAKNTRWVENLLHSDEDRFSTAQRSFNTNLNNNVKEISDELQRLSSIVEKLGSSMKELRATVHEFMARQSLGLDETQLKMVRYIPLRAYLSTATDDAIEGVNLAIDKVMRASGFEISDEFEPVFGSWYKKWFAKTTQVVTQPEVAKRLEKIERALELKGLSQPQAEIDKKQADAAATLLKAVEKVPNTAIQVGSILLVKVTGPDGPIIQVRTLSNRELIEIENSPDILSSPVDILNRLSKLTKRKDNSRAKSKLSNGAETSNLEASMQSFNSFPGVSSVRRIIPKEGTGKSDLSSGKALQLKGPDGGLDPTT